MGLLVEQVRDIESEETLINNTSTYVAPSTSWDTLHDYGNVTVSKAGLLIFKIGAHRGTSGFDGFLRLEVGANYVWAHREGSGGISQDHECFCYVDAGTYDILVQGRQGGADSSLSVDKFVCGFVAFSDMDGSFLASYSSQISITPANRESCIGALKQAVFRVQVYGVTAAGQTNFENIGDSLTNGVSLAVDGAQINFDVRNQDTGSGEGAYAEYFIALSVGAAHTFTITKDNANTTVYISIVACPWLMYDALHQPVTLDIPQGSTLYLMLEPLDGLADPTKYAYIGKVRAFSFGDATDYYYSLSGTGIQMPTYTFEIVDGQTSLLYVKGSLHTGACISHIAVDLR
jgi:hypothetical protein